MMKAVAHKKTVTSRPRRKVSYNKKVANNYEYIRDYMLWVYEQTKFNTDRYLVDDNEGEETLQDLYTIASGGLPEEWFHKVTNRYNLKALKNKKKVENYNLLFSDLQVLFGEKINRPLNYQITNKSFGSGKKKLEDFNKYVLQTLVDAFNDLSPEEIEQKQQELEQQIENYKLKYKDAKAYRGQKILDFIVEEDKVFEKIIECWRHYVTSAEVYVQVKVKDDTIQSIPLSPLHVDYAKSSQDYDSKFVQNADWVSIRYRWSTAKIIDELGDYLDEEIIKDLDEKARLTSSWFRTYFYIDYSQTREKDVYEDEEIEVVYLEFKLLQKYGILKYISPLTFEEEYVEVDEDFVLTKSMKEEGYEIKWNWKPEIWRGYLIDECIVCGVERAEIQNNKLSVIGTSFNNLHSVPRSVVKLGLPYLKMWLVLWNKIETVLKKSKGEVALIPIEAFVGGEGKQEYDFATMLSVMEESGIFPYDNSNEGLRGQAANNWLGKVNLSAINEGQFYLSLTERVKQAWAELVGFTPARKGQQKASQGVGSVQAELVQSSAITEFLFYSFGEFEKEYLTYLLELSKFAYKEGKQINIRDEYDTAYIEVEPLDHLFTEYGLFLVNSNEETKQLNYIKEIALQRSNQGASSTELIELVTSKSVASLKKIMMELEEKEQKKIEQQSKSEQDAQERMKELDKEMKQLEADMEIYKAEGISNAEFPNKKELELLKIEGNLLSFQGTQDTNNDNIPDINEVEKRSIERMKATSDTLLKAKELDLKDKEIKSKERIAKDNNKTKLKNPVVGERRK